MNSQVAAFLFPVCLSELYREDQGSVSVSHADPRKARERLSLCFSRVTGGCLLFFHLFFPSPSQEVVCASEGEEREGDFTSSSSLLSTLICSLLSLVPVVVVATESSLSRCILFTHFALHGSLFLDTFTRSRMIRVLSCLVLSLSSSSGFGCGTIWYQCVLESEREAEESRGRERGNGGQ